MVNTLDFWSNVALDAIWKSMVQESIINNYTANTPDDSSTSDTFGDYELTIIDYSSISGPLDDSELTIIDYSSMSDTFDDSEWTNIDYTPFTEPVWGVVVNRN